MKLLNNHYFSTLSCYNTRLLDSLQAKFLRLPSRSRPFILPCSCKFSVCPKNRVSVFRFMKKNCIFLYFFLSQKRCKECALAHSGVSRGRLRHIFSSRECASRGAFFVIERSFLCLKKTRLCISLHKQVFFEWLFNARFYAYNSLICSYFSSAARYACVTFFVIASAFRSAATTT